MSFYEKSGTFTNFKGRVQRVLPALEPFGQTIPLADLLRHLAVRLGVTLIDGSPEEIWIELAGSVPSYAGMTYEAIGELGEQPAYAALVQ